MKDSVLTPRRLFADLPSHTFDDYEEFQREFVARFNAHRFDFPIGYGWREALDWGVRRNLVRREGRRVVVHL